MSDDKNGREPTLRVPELEDVAAVTNIGDTLIETSVSYDILSDKHVNTIAAKIWDGTPHGRIFLVRIPSNKYGFCDSKRLASALRSIADEIAKRG